MKYKKTVTIGIITCCIVSLLFYHFRKDLLTPKVEYYVLESDTIHIGQILRGYSIILLSNVPYLKKNVEKQLEKVFWEYITLDTLHFYTGYTVDYYRETKYLTRNFKEGGQYNPEFSSWDNTMDWRNHKKDRLGSITFRKREDGTGFYSITINDTGYGFQMFIDIVKSDITYQDFNDIRAFYIRKCEELGIKKNDMEDDEEY